MSHVFVMKKNVLLQITFCWLALTFSERKIMVVKMTPFFGRGMSSYNHHKKVLMSKVFRSLSLSLSRDGALPQTSKWLIDLVANSQRSYTVHNTLTHYNSLCCPSFLIHTNESSCTLTKTTVVVSFCPIHAHFLL